MIYKNFHDKKLSALGLGLMRLPLVDNDNKEIDKAKTSEMIKFAIENGINYFDTAYNYHGGFSETIAIGEILSVYPRDSFYLASKFPGFNKENVENHASIFEEQLQKCNVEYFDFYLFHSVSDSNIEFYLDHDLGLMDYLKEQKKLGRIKHLGFSTHASLENTERFIKAYHEELDFCQIQLNWIDWTYQKAKEAVELLDKYYLPVWVMEPLRGGYLATLDESEEVKLKKLRPDESIPGWGFRFLQSIPQVTVILSGMSTLEQLEDNIETFAKEAPLSDKEMKELLAIADRKLEKLVVPCTACRYCVPSCPKLLDIPELMEAYNKLAFRENTGMPSFMSEMEEHKLPHNCIACHRCEEQCPQNIKIADTMAKLHAKIKE